MNQLFRRLLALGCFMFLFPAPAAAILYTYDLQNFSFSDGGTLTGSFTVDCNLACSPYSFDIRSSHGDSIFFFEGRHYFGGADGMQIGEDLYGSYPYAEEANLHFGAPPDFRSSLHFALQPLTRLWDSFMVPVPYFFEAPYPGATYDSRTGSDGVLVITQVPEPESYALLLAGLGLLGFAARRRKLKDAAAA